MKRMTLFSLVIFIFCAMQTGFSQSAVPGKKIIVGVLPVFDASGDVYGEVISQHMTFMLFKELQGPSIQPELLNPGGAYTPLDNDLIREFTKTDGRLGYIDTRSRMESPEGKARPELLRTDGLHMNDDGYRIWNEIVGGILKDKR